jgi:hypothetical protein
MNNLPKKLRIWLDNFDGDKDQQAKRFEKYFELAKLNKLQSPRFWAMRQILSQKSDQIIEHKISTRLSRNKSKHKNKD